MAVQPLKRACVAPVLTSGAVTSDASTAIGDLLVFIGWAQGTDTTTMSATLSDATNSWLNHQHNDGTDDGRFLIAVRKATVAGAQSYTPWSISGATSGQVSIGIYIVQAGTYDESIIASLPAANISAASATTNAVPNSPQLTPIFNVDYLFLSIGAWHITAAGTTDAGAPTSYTMAGENDPAGSHVTHLAIAERTMANLVAAENPAGFTDNVAPNGTVSCTLCIPGNRAWTADAPGSATASGFEGTLAFDNQTWSADAPGSATASGFEGTFGASGDASWTVDAPGAATAAGTDGPFSATGNASWTADAPGSSAAGAFEGALSPGGDAPWSSDAPGSASAAGFEGSFAGSGTAQWAADGPGSAAASGFEGALENTGGGDQDWTADAPGSASAAGFEATFTPTSVSWSADGPGSAAAAGFEATPSATGDAPWTADGSGAAAAAGYEGAMVGAGDVQWQADGPGSAVAGGFEGGLQPYSPLPELGAGPVLITDRLSAGPVVASRTSAGAVVATGRITAGEVEVE